MAKQQLLLVDADSRSVRVLEVSDSLPVDVYKCLGCGTQFNIARLRGDTPPETVSISGD